MKTKYLKYSILASALTVFSGCIGDLDVMPLNENVITADKAYSTPESYTQALCKLYSVWALSGQDDPGASDLSGMRAGETVLLRCWWTMQECSTDETNCAWGDKWVSEVNKLIWNTASVEPLEGLYHRSMYIVSAANDFLKNIDNAPEEINKKEYKAEARFCRALAYYILMDAFGNPPFVTETNMPEKPEQIKRVDLFNWLETELNDLKKDLPVKYKVYGRADQATVDALLARMYLNAEVYTGKARYSDCITACNNVISAGYELAPKYSELFMADNGENPNTLKEIIFPIVNDGNSTQSYGIGAIILGSRSGKEGNVENYGCNGGWDGFRSTGNLIRAFDFQSADEANWTPENIVDCRGIFYNKDRSLDITTTSIGTFTTEGWGVHKFTNLNSDGTPGKNGTFPDTDFPLFRLGEIYLMYAEAVVRGGEGGDINLAVDYVNKLRMRGYNNDESQKIDANWLKASATINKVSTTTIEFGNILNERCRELYWEALRRTDLIRFGLFTSDKYTWAEKGGVIQGTGVTDKYNLFPIPETDRSVNDNLLQNEGY